LRGPGKRRGLSTITAVNSARMLIAVTVAAVLSTHAAKAAPQDAAQRARALYARAVELEAQRNWTAALPLLWEAAGLAPRDAEVQSRLGEALERIGALDAAIAAYRVSLAERPASGKTAANLILALVKAGQGGEAVERARAIAAAAPRDPERLFTLGLAQSEVDIDGAIGTFRRVLELAPGHVLARYNLALVLKRTDRLQDALDELERALAIEPRAETQYTAGIIHWHRGDLGRAASALRDAIAMHPRYIEAHSALGSVLHAKRDWDGAAAALRRAIALAPDAPAPQYTLAQVLRSAGDARAARDTLAQAERLRRRGESEQEAIMWTSAGTEKFDRDDLAGALALFQRATAASDRYAPAYYQMGRALEGLGQPDAARRAFAKASELNPSLVPPAAPKRPQAKDPE
jgi:tetratricopeptide (TPR) repeat protein